MKLKVINLIDSLDMGGAQSVLKEYALKINKDEFEFIVICLDEFRNTKYESILRKNGVKVIFLGDNVSSFWKKNRVLNYIQKCYLLNQFVENYEVDIIHTHQAINQYLLFVNTKKTKVNLYHTYHTDIKRYIRKYKTYKFVTQYCIKYKNLTPIALHEEMRELSNQIFNTNNTIVINNGIDFSRFSNPNKSKLQVRNELEIDENDFVIGHVGRFFKVKNHEFIIRVFNEVLKLRQNSKLILVGDGPEMNAIKTLVNKYGIQNKVFFLGQRNDIPELLNSMDVFLFPSIIEGFPISLIEAQILQLRCIISNNIIREAILSESTVALDLNSSAKLWAKTILDPNVKGTKYNEIQNYNINNTIKILEDVYKRNNDE